MDFTNLPSLYDQMKSDRMAEFSKNFEESFLLGGQRDFIQTLSDDSPNIPLSSEVTEGRSRQKNRLKQFKRLAAQFFTPDSEGYYMAIALLAAHLQMKGARPNPCVGCVYVKNHQIIGWGYTEPLGGRHGEIQAALEDPESLTFRNISGAEAYITLEPCCHRGQDSCVEFLIERGIKKVWIAIEDPDPRVSGGGISRLKEGGVEVMVGLLSVAASRLIHHYLFHRLSRGKISWGAKWAQSLDGRLAYPSGKSQWISSPSSLVYSQWLRYTYDAVMIGSQTFITDKPSLGLRHPFAVDATRQPVKIIFDPYLRAVRHPNFMEHMEHLQKSSTQIIWLGSHQQGEKWQSEKKDPSIMKFFNNLHHDPNIRFVWELDQHHPIDSLLNLVNSQHWYELTGRSLISILVEGGPRLHGFLLDKGGYDFLHLMICPKWIGGPHGVQVSPSSHHPSASQVSAPYAWINTHSFAGDVLCEYSRIHLMKEGS